jgi:hypothetical protein
MPKPQHLTVNAKLFKTIAIRLAVYVPIAWLFPSFALFYLVCGLYDVARNSQLDGYTVYQYFFGRGLFTWMLSPFNIIMDIVSLPYWNKGVYRLEDLPPAHQAEVRDLIEAAFLEIGGSVVSDDDLRTQIAFGQRGNVSADDLALAQLRRPLSLLPGRNGGAHPESTAA